MNEPTCARLTGAGYIDATDGAIPIDVDLIVVSPSPDTDADADSGESAADPDAETAIAKAPELGRGTVSGPLVIERMVGQHFGLRVSHWSLVCRADDFRMTPDGAGTLDVVIVGGAL
jgi:hypothetical protein